MREYNHTCWLYFLSLRPHFNHPRMTLEEAAIQLEQTPYNDLFEFAATHPIRIHADNTVSVVDTTGWEEDPQRIVALLGSKFMTTYGIGRHAKPLGQPGWQDDVKMIGANDGVYPSLDNNIIGDAKLPFNKLATLIYRVNVEGGEWKDWLKVHGDIVLCTYASYHH